VQTAQELSVPRCRVFGSPHSRIGVKHNPWHETLEELRYARLDRAVEPKWKGLSVLLRRLKRNPEDAWAWRELAFRSIEKYETAGDKNRSSLGRALRKCSPSGIARVQTIPPPFAFVPAGTRFAVEQSLISDKFYRGQRRAIYSTWNRDGTSNRQGDSRSARRDDLSD
jgi:hypothetical protein